MSQVLVISFDKDVETLATVYFRWAGYTRHSLSIYQNIKSSYDIFFKELQEDIKEHKIEQIDYKKLAIDVFHGIGAGYLNVKDGMIALGKMEIKKDLNCYPDAFIRLDIKGCKIIESDIVGEIDKSEIYDYKDKKIIFIDEEFDSSDYKHLTLIADDWENKIYQFKDRYFEAVE